MAFIRHIPVREDHITPEALAVLDKYEEHIPWERRTWGVDRDKVRVYDFRCGFDFVNPYPGHIRRELSGIPLDRNVSGTYYQVSDTEVIITECEQPGGPTDQAVYSISLYTNTPEKVRAFMDEPF